VSFLSLCQQALTTIYVLPHHGPEVMAPKTTG
jgi:hypothetical protein